MSQNFAVTTKRVKAVNPWEPLVTFGHTLYEMVVQARKSSTCRCCKTQLNPGQLIVSNGTSSIFCGWECLLDYADRSPSFYQIHDKGLY